MRSGTARGDRSSSRSVVLYQRVEVAPPGVGFAMGAPFGGRTNIDYRLHSELRYPPSTACTAQ